MYNGDIYHTGQDYDKVMDAYLKKHGIEKIEEIITDDSGEYKKSARRMFFPSDFDKDVKECIESRQQKCQECGAETDLTIDHKTSVGEYFNSEGFKHTMEERTIWYNDISNLQRLCRSCNSKKGGERFQEDKIRFCIQNGYAE